MGRSLEERKVAALEASRRWRAKHPERKREVGRNAYHRQRAKLGHASKPRTTPNDDEKRIRSRERQSKWREHNRERANELSRNYYWRNRGVETEKARERARRNKDKYRVGYLRRKYGLTPEQYDALGSECAICGAKHGSRTRVNGDGGSYRLFVDHNHDTNKVRGLLCFGCNVAIGYLNHDPNRLQVAIDYLRRTS